MFKNRKEEILTPYRLVEEEGKGKGERGGEGGLTLLFIIQYLLPLR